MIRLLKILAPVVILALLIVWRLHMNHAAVSSQQQLADKGNRPANVAVASAAVRDIVKTFAATANIESPETVKIAPKIAGQITLIPVHEGDKVTRGQVVARIDDIELQAQLRKQVAVIAQAQARYLQAKVTQNQVSVTVSTGIQQQAAGVQGAQSDYNQTAQNYAATIAAADAAVTDAQGKVDSATAAVVNAQAGLTSAQANYNNAATQLTRENSLFAQGAVAKEEVDTAKTTAEVQKSGVGIAEAQVNAAQANRNSTLAQLKAAQQQAAIARTKGRTDIASAQSKVVQAKAQLRSAKANTTQPAAYVANLAALEADVISAKADLANDQAQLDQTVLRSPIDGYVTSRTADPGSMATAGQQILALQGIAQVWANLPVPEEQISYIHQGMTATVTIDSLPNKQFIGRVIQINPSADPSSRNYTVRLALDNKNGAIKPGMFARVSMVTEKTSGDVVVPLEAIQTGPDGPFVWVVGADSKLSQQSVKTGESDDAGTAVTEGLTAGTKVVTVSNGRLKEGQMAVVGGKGGKGKGGKGKGGHKKDGAAGASAGAPA